ncbi:MAG: 50S ribosomal protein L32 [Armatimonadota bacterium]|jgi:ribosomal protein L32|nr:50S ribosomal protein L32 [Fimbriimonadaceae bacterium]MCE2766784.1 50S ribosomal protein L32 [Fimbriimonadaceae bacterium]MCX6341220.1 50S ribosomal protein L32 [Fimbriimonadales bacterium]
MPNPKRRFSHQRTALRRTNYVATLPEITLTKRVDGEPFRLNHNASAEGFYKGRRLPGFKD